MTTKQQLIADMSARIQVLEGEARSLAGVLLGEGYLVQCEGLALTFDVEPGTYRVQNPRVCQVEEAVRFTKGDAERVAAEVTNGAGTKGKAIHIANAVREEIAETRRLLGVLQAA